MRKWSSLLWMGVACLGCAKPPVVVDDAGDDAGSTLAHGLKPLVLMLVDTSASMLYTQGCACATAGCTECLPDCDAGQRPRWHAVLSAISGSFESYSCHALQRTGSLGATYDEGYPKPFYALGDEVQQRADGVLDRYASQLAFGLATFDSMRTYVGAGDLVSLSDFDFPRSGGPLGSYSYGSPRTRPNGQAVGELAYPTCDGDLFVDTGIKSAQAPEGALVLPSSVFPPNDVIGHIKQQLRDARPFGGTPTASALDDLYYTFTQDLPGAPYYPKRYLVLLTDGAPDDDFREYPSPGCDCAARGDCPADEDPSLMRCPFPAPLAAAHVLHCGYDATLCSGPVRQLHVVGIDVNDAATTAIDSALAEAGGGQARFATTEAELSAALDETMRAILADAQH